MYLFLCKSFEKSQRCIQWRTIIPRIGFNFVLATPQGLTELLLRCSDRTYQQCVFLGAKKENTPMICGDIGWAGSVVLLEMWFEWTRDLLCKSKRSLKLEGKAALLCRGHWGRSRTSGLEKELLLLYQVTVKKTWERVTERCDSWAFERASLGYFWRPHSWPCFSFDSWRSNRLSFIIKI